MKKYIKSIALIFSLCAALFTGCSNNVFSSEEKKDSSDNATVSFSIGKQSGSRLALPDTNGSDFSDFYMTITSEDDEDYMQLYGPWETYNELTDAVIDIHTGEYTFVLEAYSSNAQYMGQVKHNVVKGQNQLNFTMSFLYAYEGDGKGIFDINVVFPVQNVKKVTAGLYNLNGKLVPGYADTEIDFNPKGSLNYSESQVKEGNYVATFNFYADDEKTLLIGTWREHVIVVNEKTSTSNITIEALSKTYSVNFELFEKGTFAEGTVLPACYSRFSKIIELPVPVQKSAMYDFEGWYTDSNFSGNPVTFLEPTDCKNITFYAKWKKNYSITFNANGGTFNVTTYDEGGTPSVSHPEAVTKVIVMDKDGKGALPSIAALNLEKSGKNGFRGWAASAQGDPLYTDGEVCSLTDGTILYAVYYAAAINPTGPTDNTDTDGDGLSDYEEINIYHTDPASKDTDGDGYTDKEELDKSNGNLTYFLPTVADLPKIKVDFMKNESGMYMAPEIIEIFTVSSSSSKGTTDSKTITDATSYQQANSKTENNSYASTWNKSATAGFGNGTNPFAFANFYFNVTLGHSGTTTEGTSATISKSMSETLTRSSSTGKSFTETETRNLTGGRINIPLEVTNNGNIAYTINSINFNLTGIKYDGSFVTKTFAGNAGTLEPGASMKFTGHVDLSLAEYKQFINLLTKFEVTVASFVIKEGNRDFTQEYTATAAKCAKISISYDGNENAARREENVSVKTKYNTEATSLDDLYSKVSLKEALESMGIKETASDPANKIVYENNMIKSIGGIESKKSRKDGDWFILILEEHPGVGENKYVTKSYTSHNSELYRSESSDLNPFHTSYNINEIYLNPHDVVRIFYDTDNDNDGVSTSTEKYYGSSDDMVDTDGDGLTDYEEIFGFERGGKIFCTNPNSIDTDGDMYFAEYKYDALQYNDKNDTDPTVPFINDYAVLNSIYYSDSDFDARKKIEQSKVEIETDVYNYTVEKQFYEYIYLNIAPQFKESDIAISVNSQSFEQCSVNSVLKIPLKANTNNTIKIRVWAPCSGYNYIDGIYSDYSINVKNSVYRPYGTISNSSKCDSSSKRTFFACLPANKDARFMEEKPNKGYVLAVGDSANIKENMEAPSIYTIQNYQKYESGVTALKDNSVKYVKLPANYLLQADSLPILIEDKRTKCSCALWCYEIEDDVVYSWKFLGKADCDLEMPEKVRLTITLDYLYAVEDKDCSCEPNYRVLFSGFPGIEQANVGNIEMCDNPRHNKRYYDIKKDTTSGNPFSHGEGYKFTKIMSSKSMPNTLSFKAECIELDRGRNDNLGTWEASFNLTNSGTYTYYSISHHREGTNVYKNAGVVYIDGERINCVLKVRDSDGDFDINYTAKFEYVWE